MFSFIKYRKSPYLCKIILTSLSFMMINSVESKEFKSANNLLELSEILENQLSIDDIWLFLDIDLTLICPTESALHNDSINQHKKIHDKIMQEYSIEEKWFIIVLAYVVNPHNLIEKTAPKILSDWKCRFSNLKIMGLTSAMTGKFQDIILEESRSNQLTDLGIDFSKSCIKASVKADEKILLSNGSRPSMYYNGILFASRNSKVKSSKGEILVAFLRKIEKDKLSKMPKVIILLDDLIENLKSVRDHMQRNYPEIKVICIRYEREVNAQPISSDAFAKFWNDFIAKYKADQNRLTE